MSAELLLGLDVGTTSTKAAVIALDGEEVAHGRAPMPWRRVPTGAEIDPAEFVVSAIAAATEALDAAPDGRVLGVGVASMAETGALLDSAGDPVVPAIAWHDDRGEAEVDALRAELGAEAFSTRTGLAPRTEPSLVKYRWLRAHEPAAARGVRWLNVGEWVVRGLGGEEIGERSLASRTGWLDLHACDPWPAALDWAGAPADLLPALQVAGTPAGAVGEALPGARGAILCVGGHDHLSAAVGAGAVGDGDVLDSCGTAEAFIRAVAPLDPDAVHAAVRLGVNVGWHAVEGRQCLLSATRSGGALQRILALLDHDRDALEAAALDVAPDAEGIVLRRLEEDRVDLVGLPLEASPAVAWRAALESVGRSGADILERMERVAGPAGRLVVAGGWAEGVAARAVKRSHLGPFESTSAVYMGARGAALTAGVAAGLWRSGEGPVMGARPRARV